VRLHRGQVAPYRNPEWQADTFAANILMPEAVVRRLILKGVGPAEIASTFEVSYSAAQIRVEKVMRKAG
jgi:Zn-dependent peptidase ImmA (M78 family)